MFLDWKKILQAKLGSQLFDLKEKKNKNKQGEESADPVAEWLRRVSFSPRILLVSNPRIAGSNPAWTTDF